MDRIISSSVFSVLVPTGHIYYSPSALLSLPQPSFPPGFGGLQPNGLILKLTGTAVDGLADFYRKVWALGNAGVEVTLSILKGTEVRDITVRSGDRYKFLQRPPRKTIRGPFDTNMEFRSKSS
jgi:hypothetical protein